MNTNTVAIASQPSWKAWNISLWIAQILLAVPFGLIGAMKTFMPLAELAEQAGAMSPGLIRFIGVAELAGALGVLLPAATRIKPMLTPLAALGLFVVMVLAAGFHLSRGEFSSLPLILLLGALAAFVAWGRWKKVTITARS